MTYCVKCGQQVEKGMKFCPECGAEIPVVHKEQDFNQEYSYTEHENQDFSQEYSYAECTEVDGICSRNGEEYFDASEVEVDRGMGILSYFGILILIPLLVRKEKSEYLKFHLNQGLILFIASIICDLLTGDSFFGLRLLFYFDWWFTDIIFAIIDVAFLVAMIMGIVSACQGTRKPLPVIDKIIEKFKIIK